MFTITKITFKDEGELVDEAIGPVTLTLADGAEVPCGWCGIGYARRVAESFGLVLERS